MKVWMYYYHGPNIPTPFMYAYTADKRTAKLFEDYRSMTKFAKFLKKMSKEEYQEFRQVREELLIQPLTDGNQVFEMALTNSEVDFISGIVTSIEDLAMENRRMIEQSFFDKETKDLMMRLNQPWGYTFTNEMYSIIDTVKIFYDYYGITLK